MILEPRAKIRTISRPVLCERTLRSRTSKLVFQIEFLGECICLCVEHILVDGCTSDTVLNKDSLPVYRAERTFVRRKTC